MNNPLFKRIVVAISIVAMIVINVLANIIPYNGKLTGEISDSFAIYFVPAGYVFAIWGLIYLLLAVYAVYQLMPKTYTNRALTAVSWWVVLSSVANSAWILLWHYQYFYTTLVVMAVLLVSLLMIYTQLTHGQNKKQSAQFAWCAQLPFSVYLGWISVATIANASAALTLANWNGFGIEPMWWSAIMIAVATVLGLLMLVRKQDIAYTLVLVWAFVGIGVKFADVPQLAQVAYFAAALLALVSLVVVVQNKRK